MLTLKEIQNEYRQILLPHYLSLNTSVLGYIFLMIVGIKIGRRRHFKFDMNENYFVIHNITKEEATRCQAYIENLSQSSAILDHDYNNNMENILEYPIFHLQFNPEKFHSAFLRVLKKFLNTLDPIELTDYKVASAHELDVNDYLEKQQLLGNLNKCIELNIDNAYISSELREILQIVETKDKENVPAHEACTKLYDLQEHYPALKFNKNFNDVRSCMFKRYKYIEPIPFFLSYAETKQKKPWYSIFICDSKKCKTGMSNPPLVRPKVS